MCVCGGVVEGGIIALLAAGVAGLVKSYRWIRARLKNRRAAHGV